VFPTTAVIRVMALLRTAQRAIRSNHIGSTVAVARGRRWRSIELWQRLEKVGTGVMRLGLRPIAGRLVPTGDPSHPTRWSPSLRRSSTHCSSITAIT